jgi:uncharacterized membrane protein YfcA
VNSLLLVPLGVVAGVLTSLSGQGGGLFLIVVLSYVSGPHTALALTTPALFLGNVHRGWLSRAQVAWPLARRIGLGAIPGALLSGFFAGTAPAMLLKAFIVSLTALTVLRALGYLKFTPPSGLATPAGAVVGFLTGTSGGAGVLLAPVTLSFGLTGVSYIGTQSVVAAGMHGARLLAYGHGGLLAGAGLLPIAGLTVGVFLGNALSGKLRPLLSPRAQRFTEVGMLSACAVLAIAGVGR